MLRLPSLGELDQGLRVRVYLCTAPTDMRKGFDTLAVLVRDGQQREEIELTEPPQEESTDPPKPVCPHAAPESWPNEPAELPPNEPGKTVIDEVADTTDQTEDTKETEEEGDRS